VHLLVSLHLVALVTLGSCRHLDGLEAAEELWQELVIVLGHLPVFVRGSCTFPGEASKATLVDYVCH
jgi:hypothetical protein